LILPISGALVPGTGVEPVRPLLTKRRILRITAPLKTPAFMRVSSASIFLRNRLRNEYKFLVFKKAIMTASELLPTGGRSSL
jgi:hypothetical protein